MKNLKKGNSVIAILIALAILGGVFVFLSNKNKSVAPTQNLPTSGAQGNTTMQGNTVTIKDYMFSPETISVKIGDTVTWTNQDSVPHTATASDGTFNSDSISQGKSYSFKFTKAGSFDYRCVFHSHMTGKVIVQ